MNKSRYLKKFSILLTVFGICGMTAAFAASATDIVRPHVKPAVQAYLLAQGTVYGIGEVQAPTTAKRCTTGTSPFLSTSIVRTQQNAAAAVQGIVNTLQLSTTDYQIRGGLFMPNQVVSNSFAIANWQIWCQPNQTA